MGSLFRSLLGLNYKTTLAGISVLVAAVGRIGLAWRARNFEAIFTDGQLIFETIGMILAGLGLLRAKDANVTGAGTQAKAVDSSGVMKNVEGDTVGKQPAG